MREAQEARYYDWNSFRREDTVYKGPLMNKTPPKPVTIVTFPQTPYSASSTTENQEGTSSTGGFNVCAAWLAKNQFMIRKKVEVETIVLDDEKDDSEVSNSSKSDAGDLVVIEENSKRAEAGNCDPEGEESGVDEKEEEEAESSDSDNSIIIIEPFVGKSNQKKKKNTKMTQLETKMRFQVKTRWLTNRPSSSSATMTSPPVTTDITTALSSTYISPQQRTLSSKTISKVLDGFSRDCSSGKREVRQWTKVQAVSSLTAPSSTFKVCSYNVLCQKTISRTGYLYKHLNNFPQFLEWNHRWAGLQDDLVSFDADILGLQEVQADHYVEHFEPFMKQHGYEGVYKQKFGTEVKDDGCAIFYRPEKFERVGYQEVNYFISPSAISNRENIAQILALRCRVTGEVILVANTHLLFNEERGDVKLAQLAILFHCITQMRSDFGTKTEFKCSVPSVMVMGDFNMEWNSLVYDYVVKGRVHVDQKPVRTMSGQSFRAGGKLCNAAELLFQTTVGPNTLFKSGGSALPQLDGSIGHSFKFDSAYHYDVKHRDDRARSVSTYHKDKAAPDFIFFTKERTSGNIQKLQVLARYALPTATALERAIPWPNKFVPSDHLPLIVKFQLTKDVQ